MSQHPRQPRNLADVHIHRRTVLRGLIGGSLVAIGLPMLERFVPQNAWADAAPDGFPKRFGLFFWGNGVLPDRWVPKATGVGDAWQLSEQLAPLAPLKSKVSVISGTRLHTPNNNPHGAGVAGLLSGQPILIQGSDNTLAGPTIDQVIASYIGGETRFKSLEFGAAPGGGQSYNGPHSINPPEVSPHALFARIFGTGFTMPGETPKFDPSLGLRRSILDVVGTDLKAVRHQVGYADQLRLDQHLDGVRELEKRLQKLELAPPKLDACKVPAEPLLEYPDIEGRPQLLLKNQLFAQLSAYAFACDQVRVFSNFFSSPVNNQLFPDAPAGHHELTHNEPGDQPEVHKITIRCVEALRDQLLALEAIPEGAGTLLDHCVILGCSEVSLGRTHSLDDMPIVLAGAAGGKLKTGVHHRGEGGENSCKVMLSIARAVGANLATFGAQEGLVKDGLSAIEA